MTMLGDKPAAGIEEMRKGREKQLKTGKEDDFPIFLQMMAEGYNMIGRNEEALSEIDDALAIVDHRGVSHWWGAELTRCKGEMLLAISGENHTKAECCFEKAIDVARQQSARSLELRAAVSFARLRQGQGRTEQARELLTNVYEWFTEGFDTADLREAKALLEELT